MGRSWAAGADNGCYFELKAINYISKFSPNDEKFDEKLNLFKKMVVTRDISEISLSRIDKIYNYYKKNESLEAAISMYKHEDLSDKLIQAISDCCEEEPKQLKKC